jgi:hypothetical protein
MKRLFLVVLFLAIFAGVLTWGLSGAFAASRTKTATVHGIDLVSTDADVGNVATAVQLFHDKFCEWVVNNEGRKSDPSFRQSGSHWGSGASPGDSVFVRGITQFNDKQGNPVRLEMTRETGRPTFIVIEYGGEGGPMTVTNGLLAELQKMGIMAH